MPFTRHYLLRTASVCAAMVSLPDIAPAIAGESTGSDGVRTVNLDERATCRQQLEHNAGPVVLMSTFLVVPDQVDNFLEGFKKQFAIMRRQPGLISERLHRRIAGSSLFMNYIVWETVDDFKRGYELPEFQAQLKQYPPGTVVSASFF